MAPSPTDSMSSIVAITQRVFDPTISISAPPLITGSTEGLGRAHAAPIVYHQLKWKTYA